LSRTTGSARMKAAMPRNPFSLLRYGRRIGTRVEGKQARQDLLRVLGSLSEGSVLVVDLEGLEVLSGSFADEALAETVAQLSAGALPGRYLLVNSPSDGLLEDLEFKLRERRLALVASIGKTWRVLGHLPPHLAQALEWLTGRKEATSQELACGLGVSVAGASVRLAELARLRLVHRVQRPRSMGGIEHWATSLISLKKAP